MFAKEPDEPLHLSWWGGLELHSRLVDRVREANPIGMKGLLGGEGSCLALASDAFLRDVVPAIKSIPDDRMADVRGMNAELVGSASLGPHVQQGEPTEPLDHLVLRDCAFGELVHQFRMAQCDDIAILDRRVGQQGCIDDVGVELGIALDDGKVGFEDGASFEL